MNVRDIARETMYTEWLTTTEDHLVSQQGDVPDVDPEGWTVSLTGAVEDSAEISVETLREDYPTVGVTHTMECAGNGRDFLEGETGDPPWGVDGVSTALWSGVPLRAVLDRHGAATGEDIWITAVGADQPEGAAFTRSIPLSKAREDCILAYRMNGEPLPREHGRPVRLLVPGWFGVNSVKWVTELRVMDRMVVGRAWDDDIDRRYWQQDTYRMLPEGETAEPRENVDDYKLDAQLEAGVDNPYPFEQLVKSVIGYPADGETVTPRNDGTIEVLGMAWAGDDSVDTIELSTDGGETWDEATFLSPDHPGAWQLFRYFWSPDPGEYTLFSRATDEHGRTQPADVSEPLESWDEAGDDEFPWNQGGYGVNAYRPHGVDVTVEK